ncbi:hypothetical protein DDJ39_23655 [Mycobacteroides abscessus]|nr:hypothetical protein DDJ39_23655 [Mycobacteroides abscessus]
MAHSFHRYRAVAVPVKVFVNYRLQTSPPAGDLLYLLAGKGVEEFGMPTQQWAHVRAQELRDAGQGDHRRSLRRRPGPSRHS